MEIRGTGEDLKALLGATSTAPVQSHPVRGADTGPESVLAGDRATLSGTGTEASLGAADEGVRADKVSEVRAALEAGTYQVPAAAVASKLIDALLNVRSAE
jgi:flagellar biosynthesis anti-sigma factor FlgM